MREAMVIAKREFLERVRTKWFVAMTLLGPVFMIGLIVIPVLIAGKGVKQAKVELVDQSGVLADKLAQAFADDDQHWQVKVLPADTADDVMMQHLREKKISGFLRLDKDALDGGQITYKGDNATNQVVNITLYKTLARVMTQVRLTRAGLPPDKLDALLKPPNLSALHTNGTSEAESGGAMFILGYIIALILYFVIMVYGISVMTSVVTEKSSRVVELMVAATNARAMMAGKIAGVGGAGLVQILIWLGVGGIALANRDALLGAFHVKDVGNVLPALGLVDIAVILAYFALGFLFYSTLYAAIGAMVSSEQDARQAQLPVTMLIVIAMVSMTAVTGDPRGSTAAILTIVPFWSPMLMPLRYLLGGATGVDVAISLGVLAVSIVIVSRAAAKIYRVGILMYGKRPGLAELVRWLRY